MNPTRSSEPEDLHPVEYRVTRLTTTWPSTRDAPMGLPIGALMDPADPTVPLWYGRRASTAPLPAAFIKAICTPRADGMRSLTPPAGGRPDHPVREALWGLAAVASLGGLLWWALR